MKGMSGSSGLARKPSRATPRVPSTSVGLYQPVVVIVGAMS